MSKSKKHRCVGCRKLFPKSKIEYEVNPYNADVYHDYTKVWMCSNCRTESSRDI